MKTDIQQDSRSENQALIQGEAHTPHLSSTSVENEQTNVHRYMNYSEGFFAFSRMENGSIPNRFYPTLNEAYRTTLTHCRDMQKVKNSKNNFFRISDSVQNILYEGRIAPSGKIIFSIYNGKEGKTVSTINSELNKLLTNKNITNMESKTNFTANAVNHNELTDNDMATAISSGATVYLEKQILTQASIKFLRLSEDCAKSIAQSVQNTAITNRDADNQSFIKAIGKASNNMICITKTLASGKPIDNNHVSFHDDLLYCASHCKSKKSLFDGSNTWKKVPGKIAYNKICDAIMDMYHTGQKMLLGTDIPQKTIMITPVHVNTTEKKKTLDDIAKDITATIMTYLRSSSDMLYYLNIKKATLNSDLESLSNGVMSGIITNDRITLKIRSGQSKDLVLNDYPTDELLRDAIHTIVSQLFIGASISEETRDVVAALVELTSIEEFYIKTMSQTPAVTDIPVEKDNAEGAKVDSAKIEQYNSLVTERLCGIIDSESHTGAKSLQISIRTFLKTCAAIAGFSGSMDISILVGLISDSFYRDLAMECLNGLAQPQYSQAA